MDVLSINTEIYYDDDDDDNVLTLLTVLVTHFPEM